MNVLDITAMAISHGLISGCSWSAIGLLGGFESLLYCEKYLDDEDRVQDGFVTPEEQHAHRKRRLAWPCSKLRITFVISAPQPRTLPHFLLELAPVADRPGSGQRFKS